MALPVRTLAVGDARDFGPMRPGERDWFAFDFAEAIGTATVSAFTFDCAEVSSPVLYDPLASTRVLQPPEQRGTAIAALVGDLVRGATYALSSSVYLSDLRRFVASARVECSFLVTDALTPGRFRQDFPAFVESDYPNEAVQREIDQIVTNLPFDVTRFGTEALYAQELWVAHRLTIFRQVARQSARTGVGLAIGAVASRSLGPASVSYDLGAAYDSRAGDLNLTPYGQLLWRLIQQFGAGPVQL